MKELKLQKWKPVELGPTWKIGMGPFKKGCSLLRRKGCELFLHPPEDYKKRKSLSKGQHPRQDQLERRGSPETLEPLPRRTQDSQMAPTSTPLTPWWALSVLKMLVTLVLFTLWLELLRSLPVFHSCRLPSGSVTPRNLHSLVADFQILTLTLCCSLWIRLFSLDLDTEVMGKLSSCHPVGGPFLFSGPVSSQFLSECVFFPGSATICPPYGMN